MGKVKGTVQLQRPECTWEDNIKMDLNKIGWENLGWIVLAVG